MTLSAIKETLHKHIDASDANRAGFLLTLIEEDLSADNFVFDDATLKMLDERWDSYSSGKSIGYTIEQSMNDIQNHRLGGLAKLQVSAT
jgi:hypothetical protein